MQDKFYNSSKVVCIYMYICSCGMYYEDNLCIYAPDTRICPSLPSFNRIHQDTIIIILISSYLS